MTESRRRALAKYNASVKGKAAQKRYRSTAKGRTARNRMSGKYRATHPGRHYTAAAIRSQIKQNAQRRGNG